MQADFIQQVRQEHQAIAEAILARDPAAARAAAARHMHEASRRLHDSDAPIRRAAATANGQTA